MLNINGGKKALVFGFIFLKIGKKLFLMPFFFSNKGFLIKDIRRLA
jgi:hypothetical protein